MVFAITYNVPVTFGQLTHLRSEKASEPDFKLQKFAPLGSTSLDGAMVGASFEMVDIICVRNVDGKYQQQHWVSQKIGCAKRKVSEEAFPISEAGIGKCNVAQQSMHLLDAWRQSGDGQLRQMSIVQEMAWQQISGDAESMQLV